MSLRHVNKKLVVPNSDEELSKLLFDSVESDMDDLISQGWKDEIYGKTTCAIPHWKGVRMYRYLMFLVRMMQRDYYRRLALGEDCPQKALYDKYKIDCVRKNLQCISKELGKNFNTALDNFLSLAGLPLTDDCVDCPGIGTMIMEGESFPTAYDINLC